MKKRLSLDELQVTSFVTVSNYDKAQIMGGLSENTCAGSGCPDICETIRGTKCMTQTEPVETEPVPVEEEYPTMA